MDISIVTGTYNRITSLKRMVSSVRKSLEFPVENLYNFFYEIVIVDGGSTDGTIEWCKTQEDIKLIEHGELLGAVRAFNDGAFSATGNYVILANDDISFLLDSVYKAWLYATQIENLGIGCFYQDRNGKDFHVEEMPVVVEGRQTHLPYGQVCIVPKWLGDKVGWWGNYLKTYGGDNELSSRVYELGFKVHPFLDCRISDYEIDDELRKMNNISGAKDPRAKKGHHPDSWAWGRTWRRGNLVGPNVKYTPVIESKNIKKKRILYLPIFEQGWNVQKEQKKGLREGFIKNDCLVLEVDYFKVLREQGKEKLLKLLSSYIMDFVPDIVLTQLHNQDPLNDNDIRKLKSINEKTTWVNWNGDFWPQNLTTTEGIKLNIEFDLVGLVNRDVIKKYKTININAHYWQIGWEPDGVGFEPDRPEHLSDVVFLGSGYSKDRQVFVRYIKQELERRSTDFALWGGAWPDGWSRGQTTYDFKTGCRIYRGAKISLGDSQWPESGFVSNRVFQALAAGGSALAHQWFYGMEDLGLIDGKTCIVWRTKEELISKIEYYLANESERFSIAWAGHDYTIRNHSFVNRVIELFNLLENVSEKEMESWR